MTNTIKLSNAQTGAMECRNWDEEPATRLAWDGGSLLTLPASAAARYQLWNELNEASNAEDAQAEIQGCKYARRAATSLACVAGKVLKSAYCVICGQAEGTVDAVSDNKPVRVCEACFAYETEG